MYTLAFEKTHNEKIWKLTVQGIMKKVTGKLKKKTDKIPIYGFCLNYLLKYLFFRI